MNVVVVAAAVALQVSSGIVRVRGWFYCVRESCPPSATVRFRDVVIAHLGSSGWNGVLPARGGEAVKVALLRRRLPLTPIGTLAGTLVPTSLVEAGFTAILLSAVLAAGIVSPATLTGRLPADLRVPVLVVGAACALVGAGVVWRRAPGVVRDLRAGLAVLGHPRVLVTRVIPWQLASRVLRLIAFAALLAAAGLPPGLGPALVLMAAQGATPSVGPASAAVRVAMVTAAFPAANGAIDATHAAQVLIAATLATSAVNLAISAVMMAIILRTASPRRIVSHVRGACRRVSRTGDSADPSVVAPPGASSGFHRVPAGDGGRARPA